MDGKLASGSQRIRTMTHKCKKTVLSDLTVKQKNVHGRTHALKHGYRTGFKRKSYSHHKAGVCSVCCSEEEGGDER